MKPSPFEYLAPRSADEAVRALAYDPDAKVLAGGQSLVPLMNLRLAHPSIIVDINGLDELDHVTIEDGTVRIGALCRHHRLETDPGVARYAPLLAEAVRHVGHPHIRN